MSKQALKRVRKALGLEVNREPLPAFAWPGGYPVAYLTIGGDTLCPKCVNENIVLVADKQGERDWWVRAWYIHWEGEPEVCCHCNAEIESAYGVPD